LTSKEKRYFIEIKMGPKAKKQKTSRSTRAGIIFPVARINRFLKSAPTATTRVTQGASVYLASVIEYLVGMYIIQKEKYH
jgi:hypothetical protein